MTTNLQAYRFALDPTPTQETALRSHCGAQRYAFNWGLALIKANLDQRTAEKSYEVTESELTASLSWSAYSLRKLWNQAKNSVAPWCSENSKEAYSSGLANLAVALVNWSNSKNGTRSGPTVRFPRFKGKRAGLSCRFTTGSFGLADRDRRHVHLPRIGVIRTHESTRKLARHIERGTARIRSATITYQGERWFCSFSVEIDRQDPAPSQPNSVVGVDLGVTAVANARRNGLHKLSTRLVRTHGVIVLEDLHVAGMVRNRRLARHIAGIGMSELRRQITYKSEWVGGRVHLADRWFPSSKTCSDCGAAKTKLRLSERTFHCDQCEFSLDRDLNAARNLAALVDEVTGGMSSPSCGATQNEPDGNPRKTRTTRAPGTATGRPTRSTPRREARAHMTWLHVS